MLLNALSNYLSNQPLNTENGASAVAPAAPAKESEKEIAADLKDLYKVSDRAVLISAVASEFDVTDLSPEDIGRMQTRLQEYGLLSGRELNGMQYLFQAGAAEAGATQAGAAGAEVPVGATDQAEATSAESPDQQPQGSEIADKTQAVNSDTETQQISDAEPAGEKRVNALAVLENLRSNIAENGGSFSFRQQVSHFHTLISNLASARSL